jgi:hypothetical protein
MVGRRLFGRATVGLALGASLLVDAAIVRAADDRQSCDDSYVQAQRLRKAGKLRAAHDQLLVCARPTCPSFVTKDCTAWLTEVEKQLPTIVVTAKDVQGNPVTQVTVFMDDEKLTDQLDGRGISVDPGPHKMRYEYQGNTVTRDVVVAEGAKDQPLTAEFAPPQPSPPKEQPPTPPPATSSGGIPTATYVLGGVAVAGLLLFTYFGIKDLSDQGCKPNCTQDQADSVHTNAHLADISLLVGLLAGGGAAYFYFTRKPEAATSGSNSTTMMWLGARPELGGASLRAGWNF